jgi:GTP-binding protein
VIYTNARAGTATVDLRHPGTTLEPLLDALLTHIPPPLGDTAGSLQLLVSNLDHDNHIGRLAIGRITRGVIRPGQEVVRCSEEGIGPRQRIATVLTVEALQRIAAAGGR